MANLGNDSETEEDPEDETCPICIEPLDDVNETKRFLPCPCNYRVCMFCVRRIQTEFDGRCPGCRRDYKESDFRFVDKPPSALGKNRSVMNKRNKNKQMSSGPVNVSHGGLNSSNNNSGSVGSINNNNSNAQGMEVNPAGSVAGNGHARSGSVPGIGGGQYGVGTSFQANGVPNVSGSDLNGAPILRKDLSNVRVVQRNLVYLVGLAPSIAKEDILRSKEFFGQYGKIVKVAINRNDRDREQAEANNNTNNSVGGADRSQSYSAYITFAREDDAKSAIKAVNGFWVDNYVIKASFGTTKYCNMFLRGLQCTNPDCLYLHKLGDDASSFTKEEMQAGRANFHDMTQVRAAGGGVITGLPADQGSLSPQSANDQSSSGNSGSNNPWTQVAAGVADDANKKPLTSGGWAAAAAGVGKATNTVVSQPSSTSNMTKIGTTIGSSSGVFGGSSSRSPNNVNNSHQQMQKLSSKSLTNHGSSNSSNDSNNYSLSQQQQQQNNSTSNPHESSASSSNSNDPERFSNSNSRQQSLLVLLGGNPT